MSRSQGALIGILAVATACVFFWLGLSVLMYLAESFPSLSLPPVAPTDVPTVVAVPSATEPVLLTTMATSTPTSASPTAAVEPSQPTQTRVIPLSTPPLLPTPVRRMPAAPDSWEPDDARSDASPLGLGEGQTHNLHVESDHDWVYFDAEEGSAYVIETSNLGHEVDTIVELFDEEGHELASDDDGGEEFHASRLWWVAEASGRLYVKIGSFSEGQAGGETSYDVSLRLAEGFRIDQYEPDDYRGRARLIAVGEIQTHNRHVAGDRDWVYFEAQAGVTYIIETFNLGPDADTVVHVYDQAGEELGSDDDSGDEIWASRLEWMPPQDGPLYVLVEEWFETSVGPGTRYDIAVQTR
jgi:ribosomal protein S11